MGTRLLDGRCRVTVFFINRLVRFLALELSRCLVTSRSLERLVTLFGAGSSFGHVSLFFDYVVVFLSLETGRSLPMFCLFERLVTFPIINLITVVAVATHN